MANRSGKGGSSDRFLLLGSEITVEGDCCHEIRRRLLLGRKAMTYLDSVLKSRDITLPTKVCIIKAMVFPVVIYGCESWIVKKVDSQKIGAFKLRCWKRLLRVSWTARRSNQSILKSTLNSHRKDYAEAETPVIWSSDVNNWLTGKVPDAGKDWGQEEKRVSEDEMSGWHHRCNGHELQQTSGDGEGQGSLARCSPWGCKESDVTGWWNNNNYVTEE